MMARDYLEQESRLSPIFNGQTGNPREMTGIGRDENALLGQGRGGNDEVRIVVGMPGMVRQNPEVGRTVEDFFRDRQHKTMLAKVLELTQLPAGTFRFQAAHDLVER